MRKRTLVITLIMLLVVGVYTGCVKRYYEDEEVQAMADLGRSIVSDYLEDNDIDATIVTCEATIYGTPVRYITAYANGTIEEDGVTYEFYVDTETRQIYSGKYSEEISSVIENIFYDAIGLDEQDFISIKTSEYGLVLPNKWGNEHEPSGDVILDACVVPIEVTDVEEYILSDDSLMLYVNFEAVANDDVDLSFLEDTDYLNTYGARNILPYALSIRNRLFIGNVYPSNMFYYEYELVEFEEFQMGVLTHVFSMNGGNTEEYTYDVGDVTITNEGESYNFSLLERYEGSFSHTRLNFYYVGDNPPELSCSFVRDGSEVSKGCYWEEQGNNVWALRVDDHTQVFKRDEFVIIIEQ